MDFIVKKLIPTSKSSAIKDINDSNGKIDKVVIEADIVGKINIEIF